MKNDYKPFSISDAKAGAPIACRNGFEATILKFDGRNHVHPLIGVIGETDVPAKWSNSGCYERSGIAHPLDLVMLPLGEIDGRPVFVGDGVEFRTRGGDWVKKTAQAHERMFPDHRWPAPEKQYPVSSMSEGEMRALWSAGASMADALTLIANAALRHAIDHGTVATLEAYGQVREDLLEAERKYDELRQLVNSDAKYPRFVAYKDSPEGIASIKRAARDMAIAEAVLERCKTCIGNSSLSAIGMDCIDLVAIISKVQQ